MAFDPHKNFAFSTVATAPSPASSGTSVTVQAGDGALFPDPATLGAYNVVIAAASGAGAEVARVTAKATDVLTITRAQESSGARSVVVGDSIFVAITAKTLTDIEYAASEVVAAAITSDTTSTTAGSDVDLVTFAAATFAAAKHYLDISIPCIRHSVALSRIQIKFKEGAVQVGKTVTAQPQTAAGDACVRALISFTPTAASHTYKITWDIVTAGTGTIIATAFDEPVFRITRA